MSRKEQEIKDVVDGLSKLVNSYSADSEEFANQVSRQHRTLQQNIGRIVIATLKMWAEAYEKGWYDERNLAICQLASSMLAGREDTEFMMPFI